MVDGINNIGSGLRALAGTYSANASSVAATVISSPPGISAARLNWMPVAVSKVLENNLLGLRTPMGEMSVRSNSAEFKVGDRLLIKMDASGGLSINLILIVCHRPWKPPEMLVCPLAGHFHLSALLLLSLVAAVEPIRSVAIGPHNLIMPTELFHLFSLI